MSERDERTDRSAVEILVLGVGCSRCDELEAQVLRSVSILEMAASVRRVSDEQELVTFGFITTPALLVNGKLRAAGKDLTDEMVRDILAKEMR